MVYCISIEDEEDISKKYFQFKNKQRALQICGYSIDNFYAKGNVKLMDKDFNPVHPFEGQHAKLFILYQ